MHPPPTRQHTQCLLQASERKNEECRAFPNPCQHLPLFPNRYLMCTHTPALVLKQPSSSRNRRPLGREKRRKSGYIRAVCIGTSLLKQDQTGRGIIKSLDLQAQLTAPEDSGGCGLGLLLRVGDTGIGLQAGGVT